MTLTESNPEAAEFPADQYAPGPNPPAVRDKVPYAMSDPLRIPKERYYARDFFEMEKEHLWPHSWLMAARLAEIPNPGDFTEFEIVGNSILIVRQADGSVKALHNACRHRATELAKGCGRFLGGQIVCPFHGWRWNIDGSNSFVFVEEGFDPACLTEDHLHLRECKVEVWAGMVWINMDHDAPPLAEALSPMMGILDGIWVENLSVKWWKQVILNANWKIAMEAFLEGYHVYQTHPQLLQGGGEEFGQRSSLATEYTAFRGGHGRFQGGTARMTDFDLEDFIESHRLLADGQDAMALDRDVQIFESVRTRVDPDDPAGAMAAAVAALYEFSAGQGIPLAPPSQHMKSGGESFLFPNFFMLPMYGNCLSYRSRPYADDPEKCVFDVWSLTTYPTGYDPGRAELLGVFDKEDVEHWGQIPLQDFSNIERQQRGLHSQSYEAHTLSPRFEKTITNYHEELDRVLAAGASRGDGSGAGSNGDGRGAGNGAAG